MTQFLFLVCSERSGSNFITSLLNGHSSICGPAPTHLFRLFGTNAGNYGDLAADSTWQVLAEDMITNFECKLGTWLQAVSAEELMSKARSRTTAAMLEVIYDKEATADQASHVFVKENHTYRFAPFLLAHFPSCRLVWMIRDPRDVASSWVKTESIPGGIEKAVSTWVEDQQESLSLYHQLRGSGRIIRISYEELIADTEATLRRLTEYFGLPFEETMLEFYRQPRVRENAQRIHAWSNLGIPVMTNNAGKFRHTLSEHDLRYVELSCHHLMVALGYQPELVTEPPDESGVAEQLAALQPQINPGSYRIESEDEQRIREQRLAAIRQVLERRL
jgi:LPS sulfotransferase NodH